MTLNHPLPSPSSPASFLLPIPMQIVPEQDPKAALGLWSFLHWLPRTNFLTAPFPDLKSPIGSYRSVTNASPEQLVTGQEPSLTHAWEKGVERGWNKTM